MEQRRYWLRGGIVAVIIHAILSIIYIFIAGWHPVDNSDLIGLFFPNIFLGIPMIGLANFLNIEEFFGFHSILLYLMFYWFLIGTLFGWLYGKFKNRSKII